jgi:hypothetical protein
MMSKKVALVRRFVYLTPLAYGSMLSVQIASTGGCRDFCDAGDPGINGPMVP